MRPHPVLALVAANLRRHSRDRVGLFFIVVMPFVSIVFVGMALGGGAAASRLPVGVVAQESDPVAAAVLAELRAHPDLEITSVGGEEELRAGVRGGALAAGVVIPPGSTTFELVMTQSSGSGMAARSAVDVSVGRVAAVIEATRAATSAGATPAQAAELVRKAQAASADVEVVNSDTASGTPRGFAYTAPANLLLFTFINSMAVAAALVESRRIGMLPRAFTAPVRRGAVLFGEALSRFIVAAAQAVLIMVVSSLLFGVSWGEPFGVAAVVGVFALVATGAAILMGSLVRSSAQPSAIGPPLGIVLGMLGGCLWPAEAAGQTLTAIGHLFPHAWGMDALLTLSRPGTGLGDVLPEVAVLGLMAAVLLSLSLVLFSRRTRTL
ncbi:ABC transporter permease [Herbidospora galbida]|uniref:ABC transporter permease n=1 Tax=Herbidospora galbida TaxID=2575442 RepID=A0A4U3M6U9_9ACTN|nr:ABC transporter permease [Herbidospora galbida]TKK84002.1 ABC transporter permease [Herbidospora galbida]